MHSRPEVLHGASCTKTHFIHCLGSSRLVNIRSNATLLQPCVCLLSEIVNLERSKFCNITVLSAGHRCSCMVRNLETVNEVDALVERLDDRRPDIFCHWVTRRVGRCGLGVLVIVQAELWLLTGVLLHDLFSSQRKSLLLGDTGTGSTKENGLLQIWLTPASSSSSSHGICKEVSVRGPEKSW